MSLNPEMEKLKLMENSISLERKIIFRKSGVETVLDQIAVKKNLLHYYEQKLGDLFTEIASVEWNHTKANLLLKSDAQFAESFKNKFLRTDLSVGLDTAQSMSISYNDKILDLKREIETFELYCKENDEKMGALLAKFSNLRDW